ncbi:MAG: tetratricopeptide repeat protein, partial [Candidatus Muiribacteriaceae bacterium]
EQKKAQDLLSESSEHYRKREYIEAELKLKRLIRKYDVIYNKQNRSMLRDIYFLLGRTGLKMNNKDDAIYYFKKAHETENTHSDTLLELGDIFFARERYQMALSYYRKAFELSKDIRTYGNIGICLINLNMYDDALGILKEVYTKEPDNLNAIYNLFICYHYLDNTGKAVEFGEMLIEKAPENSEISKNARNLINIIKDGED